eukprot:m.239382 g.239382  ORF g.239382 m.239382 type:complete len:304 (-) comp15295_c1_seq5:585-1496(-)
MAALEKRLAEQGVDFSSEQKLESLASHLDTKLHQVAARLDLEERKQQRIDYSSHTLSSFGAQIRSIQQQCQSDTDSLRAEVAGVKSTMLSIQGQLGSVHQSQHQLQQELQSMHFEKGNGTSRRDQRVRELEEELRRTDAQLAVVMGDITTIMSALPSLEQQHERNAFASMSASYQEERRKQPIKPWQDDRGRRSSPRATKYRGAPDSESEDDQSDTSRNVPETAASRGWAYGWRHAAEARQRLKRAVAKEQQCLPQSKYHPPADETVLTLDGDGVNDLTVAYQTTDESVLDNTAQSFHSDSES